uniref:Glutaredoxin domain-containing protein n=1 Tax=viral metagenome TaxID=1070528 RepID=A0A6C0J7R6_9ZZZZ
MFYVYSLKHCPYSISAVDVLERSGLRYKNIMVAQKDKSKYCKKHKMNTFPQIFYKKDKKMYKIGGCSDLLELFKLCKYLNTLPFKNELVFSLAKTFKRKKIN